MIAFVDVDRLKAINDTFGHAAGDGVLRDVGSVLRNSLRSYDLVIRIGGDELVCALPGTDLGSARRRFARLGPALSATNSRASVSVGMAELQPEESLSAVLRRADAALYRTPRSTSDRCPRGGSG